MYVCINACMAPSLQVTKWFPSITALVVGPGLGRDERMQEVAALVIEPLPSYVYIYNCVGE